MCRTVDGVREPWVVEHTFSGCTSRRLQTFFDHYDDVGVLFLDLSTTERHRLRRVALSYLGTTPRYAWDEVFLAGIYALVRHRRGTKASLHRCRAMKAVEAAIHRRNHSPQRAMFCTTFVLQVFADSDTATPKQLGRLAPPHGSPRRGIAPTEFDRMMQWAIPLQMAAGVISLLALLLAATVQLFSRNLDPCPAMFSPSDYWRHTPAQLRWIRQPSRKSSEPVPVELTPALLRGRSRKQRIAA